MTLLSAQCIHRLNEVGVRGEGLERGRLIGAYQAAPILVVCSESRAQLPSHIVVPVTPDPLNRVQSRTVGREPHGADSRWPTDAAGGVRAAVSQEQAVEAVGNRVGERVHQELDGVGIQLWPFQQEALARSRGSSPIDEAPVEGGLDQPYRPDATGRAPSAAPRQPANAAFVLTAYADWAALSGGMTCWSWARPLP
jgi:hypothetical protein